MPTKQVAAKAPGKQVATTNDQGANLPDYLRDYTGGSGLQGLDSEDFVIPRIKLLQGTSPELEVHETAKNGIFWVNVIDLPLGTDFEFTPILNRKRYMLMPPYGDDRGVFARANDGKTWHPGEGKWEVKLKGIRNPITWEIKDASVKKSGLASFGSSNPDDPDSNPAATLFYDFLVLVHDQPDLTTPVLLSLARSAAKKGRDLQGKIAFGSAPMQARKFQAKPIKDSSTEGDFNNWQFAASGFVTESVFNQAKALEKQFGSINFRGAEDEDTGGDASSDGAGSDAESEY